ncbi:MAG TPA: SurA N-terminal domain-containing protein [Ornithinimicrobium sp.]|uniref:SurA N-terminal domain-containing protein n=1 Tax=Ornithinimicrobium sp. TaxID=1977084 RepID=UPI002B47D421|nr:SurA N-terminal domain-containing protein [Ornithinimicrobium sp.]HKJ12160.1 SurA N-terminal domain-containing protein [Ornithinimicrobium sp.]
MKHSFLTRAATAAALAAVTLLAACGGDSEDAQPSSDDAATSQGPEGQQAPEADVEDVPKVVAEVNDEEISREEFVQAYEGQFQQAAMQSQQAGGEVDQQELKEETARDMVNSLLLVQAAQDEDISVTDKEIQNTLERLATGNGMASVEEFMGVLKEQDFTEKQVRREVEKQLLVEKYVAAEGKVDAPSKKEQQELYDKLTEQQEGQGEDAAAASIPPFEDVQPQLRQQLEQEAEAAAVDRLVKQLRDEADITVNL